MRLMLLLATIGACSKPGNSSSKGDDPLLGAVGSASPVGVSQPRDGGSAEVCDSLLDEADVKEFALSPGSKEVGLRADATDDDITVHLALGGKSVYETMLRTDQARVKEAGNQSPPWSLDQGWATAAEADGSYGFTSYVDQRVAVEVYAYKGDHILQMMLRGPAPLTPDRLKRTHEIGRRVLSSGISPDRSGVGVLCSTILNHADAAQLGLSRSVTMLSYRHHATDDSIDVYLFAGGQHVYERLLGPDRMTRKSWAAANEADDSFDVTSEPMAGFVRHEVVARKGDHVVQVVLAGSAPLTSEREVRAHAIARRVLGRL